MERIISFVGLFAMIGIAWLMSSDRKRLNFRIVGGGLLLQFIFALLILKTSFGREQFDKFDGFFRNLMGYVDVGSSFMFNVYPRPGDEGLPSTFTLLRTFAFGVLPTIIFFSSLMSVLYYLGVMQFIIKGLAVVMQRTLGTSGAESLSAAANIFVGQTEAPLVVRPYVTKMTRSELMSVMVGGFSTIAGGVMAAYVGMGINAGHLLTASVISAPAALLIAKVLQPEVDAPETLGEVRTDTERPGSNLVEAAAIGATDGMKLALNVCAMLIAFIALLAMCNAFVGWIGSFFNAKLSIELLLGYLFWPIAWLMGIESSDCMKSGELLGLKLVATEFVAYDQLAAAKGQLSERTVIIMTYALSGFANFGSVGIQIGGIGAMAPERRSDLAKLGMRAMFGGMLACCMTACIAGILL